MNKSLLKCIIVAIEKREKQYHFKLRSLHNGRDLYIYHWEQCNSQKLTFYNDKIGLEYFWQCMYGWTYNVCNQVSLPYLNERLND